MLCSNRLSYVATDLQRSGRGIFPVTIASVNAPIIVPLHVGSSTKQQLEASVALRGDERYILSDERSDTPRIV